MVNIVLGVRPAAEGREITAYVAASNNVTLHSRVSNGKCQSLLIRLFFVIFTNVQSDYNNPDASEFALACGELMQRLGYLFLSPNLPFLRNAEE